MSSKDFNYHKTIKRDGKVSHLFSCLQCGHCWENVEFQDQCPSCGGAWRVPRSANFGQVADIIDRIKTNQAVQGGW